MKTFLWYYQITLITFGSLALMFFWIAMTFFDFDANKWRTSIKGSLVGLSILLMMGGLLVVGIRQDRGLPQSVWTFAPMIVGWLIGQGWIAYYSRKMNIPVCSFRGPLGSI